MRAQRRLRSAWASAQSDQSLRLSAWRKLGSLAIHWAYSEDWSDWADVMRRLIYILCFQDRISDHRQSRETRNSTVSKNSQELGGQSINVCSACELSTALRSNMKRHLKSHIGQKDYIRHLCEKGLARIDNLREHITVLVITWFLLWYTARKDGGGLLLIEFLAKVSSIFSLFSLFLSSELYTIFQPTFIRI